MAGKAHGTDSGMFFALEAGSGVMRHIREVKTGLACDCTCPGCGDVLEGVNAESIHYVRRPHFRHVSRPPGGDCALVAVKRAILEGLQGRPTILLPPAVTPGEPLFQAQPDEAVEARIEEFRFIDTAEALLRLEDGRELRVLVTVLVETGQTPDETKFDLQLHLPAEELNLGSAADLRRFLTLDRRCWRWCRRQTAPNLFEQQADATAEPPPFVPAPALPVPVTPAPVRTEGPRDSYTHRVDFPDGMTMLYHRQIWWNGIMTERRESVRTDQLEAPPSPDLGA